VSVAACGVRARALRAGPLLARGARSASRAAAAGNGTLTWQRSPTVIASASGLYASGSSITTRTFSSGGSHVGSSFFWRAYSRVRISFAIDQVGSFASLAARNLRKLSSRFM
jgi:hypothetical protein